MYDTYYADTAYFAIVQGYVDGQQWGRAHQDTDACMQHFTGFMNNWHFLFINYTNVAVEIQDAASGRLGDDTWFWENTIFNVTSEISSDFQMSMYHCTLFFKQLQKKYYIQKEQFIDETDLYTSFLFGLLSNSYEIKLDLDQMIVYDEENDLYNFWRTLGSVHKTMLDFESTAASLVTDDDEDSPYIQDAEGNVFLKKDLQKSGELDEDDESDDEFDYEYVMEEEVTYEDLREERAKKEMEKDKKVKDHAFRGAWQPLIEEKLKSMDDSKHQHRKVRQDATTTTAEEESGEYVFSPFDIFDFYFGFVTGGLNTLPVGSYLNQCGKELRAQQ